MKSIQQLYKSLAISVLNSCRNGIWKRKERIRLKIFSNGPVKILGLLNCLMESNVLKKTWEILEKPDGHKPLLRRAKFSKIGLSLVQNHRFSIFGLSYFGFRIKSSIFGNQNNSQVENSKNFINMLINGTCSSRNQFFSNFKDRHSSTKL